MKNLKQLSVVLIILFLCEALQQKFNIPVPGTILGMTVLLLLLIFKVIKLKSIENITNTLLGLLSIFFVPVNVGIVVMFDQIKDTWLSILLVLIVSTIVVMTVTGVTVQLLDKHFSKQKEGEE